MTNPHVVVHDPKKGEIWKVRFNPSKGAEITKTRPAVVVNEDKIGHLRLRIVVPVTAWQDRYKRIVWMVHLDKSPQSNLDKISAADTSQVKSVSVDRFARKVGTITLNELEEILAGISLCIGYNP
ncbi:MAG: type II toxin-antitoxin system PemK/MazF family toxin [Deltaproteobacteria bacterium]|nr:type II toxin-antitoxin system PemK/MazF family toxin [Deltaproteobacteria bacterium]